MTEVVRCKFICLKKTESKGWTGSQPIHYGYEFGAVTDGSEENKAFFAATPVGEFKVATVTRDLFEVGQEVYLDITPA